MTTDSAVALASAGISTSLALGSLAVPFRGGSSGKVEAPVVFAGYGLRVAEIGRDDYADLDVRGKIVLVLRGQPHGQGADARLTEHRATLYANKFAAAERAGAAAILFCNRAEDGVEPTAEREDADVRFALRAQGDTKLPAVWIRRDVALNLFRRPGLGLLERQALIDAGKTGGCGEIPGATATIALEFEPPRPPRLSANVIGWLEGRDLERRGEFVVVGAHHDHLGRGEFGSLGGQAAVGVVHPGADDNASGVAAVLEVARRIAAQGGTGRSVVFIAFAAGEAGMQGSRAFLEHCPLGREKIVAMVNLDSVGRAAHKPLQVEGVGSGLAFSDLFGRAARRVGIEYQLRDEAGSRADRSDHIAFLARKIPSVWLTTGVHEQYRRPSDVAALVDMDGVERIAQVVSEAVLDLGGWAKRPEFGGEVRRK